MADSTTMPVAPIVPPTQNTTPPRSNPQRPMRRRPRYCPPCTGQGSSSDDMATLNFWLWIAIAILGVLLFSSSLSLVYKIAKGCAKSGDASIPSASGGGDMDEYEISDLTTESE